MANIGPFRVPSSLHDVGSVLRALSSGLRRLTFSENFDSWETTQTIASGAEAKIRNEFRDGHIPTGFLVTFSRGENSLVAGTTTWTADFVYIKNVGAVSSTATIRFFR